MRLRPRTPRLARLALALALVAPAPALAGPPTDAPRPIFTPWTFGPEQDGVEALLHHAAGLGFMSSFELGLGVTTRLSGAEPVNSVVGLAGGRLGPLAFGLGVASVGDGPGTDTATTRVDVGLAVRLGDHAAVGLQWLGLSNDSLPALDAYGAWSLSADLRPLRALAIALSLDRLDSPRFGAETLDPIARLAVGVRPGTERVTLGVEASRELADDARWTLGGSARFMLIPGLVVGGYGRWRTAESGPAPDAVEAGAFLGLYQGGLALESSVDHAVVDPDATASESTSSTSLSFLLKARSERHPSLTRATGLVVRLPIRGPIPERPSVSLFGSSPSGFAQWLQALDVIAHDPDVAGVLLQIERAPAWGQSWELRRALERIKAAGKRVHAVMSSGDMRAMYLASVADRVHLHAAGGLMLTGLSTTRTYLFGLLERLGVRVDVAKHAEYKSALEALTLPGPSGPAAEQDRAVLNGIYAAWLDAVGAGRGLDRPTLERVLETGPQTMHAARAEDLVDTLLDDDAIAGAIRDDMGPDVRVVERYRPAPRAWRRWGGQRRIAVVPIVGSIVDGPSGGALPIPLLGSETTGEGSIVPLIQAAAADSGVVAIVVRVSTGGGSALASDKMHRALLKANEVKPVIVSFGDVAASGGYYVAVAGRAIFASPLTVTGSIGIIAGKADLSGLFALLGVTTSTQRTSERADAMGSHRPWTEAEREIAEATLGAYYERFVSLVAAGRGLTPERAHELAKGRVWLGTDALAHGLVDSHGGLWDAIERARAEAGVAPAEPLALEYVGTLGPLSSFQRLVAGVIGLDVAPDVADVPLAPAVAARVGEVAERLRALADGGPLALMPYTLAIE